MMLTLETRSPSGARIDDHGASHTLTSSARVQKTGCGTGTPLGTVRIERGEGPETFARGLQVAPQLERIESLIDGLQRVALRRGEDARGADR
jgi:hypothetical protein